MIENYILDNVVDENEYNSVIDISDDDTAGDENEIE